MSPPASPDFGSITSDVDRRGGPALGRMIERGSPCRHGKRNKSAPSAAAASIGTAAGLATNAFNASTRFNFRNLDHNLSGAFVACATKPETRKEDL